MKKLLLLILLPFLLIAGCGHSNEHKVKVKIEVEVTNTHHDGDYIRREITLKSFPSIDVYGDSLIVISTSDFGLDQGITVDTTDQAFMAPSTDTITLSLGAFLGMKPYMKSHLKYPPKQSGKRLLNFLTIVRGFT